MLQFIEIDSSSSAEWSVIWLHGLGADGHDFAPLVSQFSCNQHAAIRYILPHAPVQAVTLNQGMVMPAWYDITSLDLDNDQDDLGVHNASKAIIEILNHEEMRGIPPERQIVAGFSQGAAVALHTALTTKHKLAGVIALSGYLPLQNNSHCDISTYSSHRPDIFFAYGEFDPLIASEYSRLSIRHLHSLGCNIHTKIYPIEHTVSQEESHDIDNWLLRLTTTDRPA